MRVNTLTSFLTSTVNAHLPVLITGAPGIGKTDIVTEVARLTSADLLISHPVTADPTDAKGIPFPAPDGLSARFLPFGDTLTAINANRLLIWLLDDLGQAAAAVQAAFMQLILSRRLNGHVLPEHVVFIACTNRREDRAGVSGILEPVKSRFAAIVSLEPHIDDWTPWYFTQSHADPRLAAFLRHRPTLLHDFKPSADMTNTPSPRTWANLSRLQSLTLPTPIFREAAIGAVGEGAATEYAAFCDMYASLVTVDSILLDPHTAGIPSSPSELYAVSTGLGFRASVTTYPQITAYAQRMLDAGHGEFAALTVRDCQRREPTLANTAAHTRLMSGEFGKLLLGEVN